jgi:hypothetical protein
MWIYFNCRWIWIAAITEQTHTQHSSLLHLPCLSAAAAPSPCGRSQPASTSRPSPAPRRTFRSLQQTARTAQRQATLSLSLNHRGFIIIARAAAASQRQSTVPALRHLLHHTCGRRAIHKWPHPITLQPTPSRCAVLSVSSQNRIQLLRLHPPSGKPLPGNRFLPRWIVIVQPVPSTNFRIFD